MLNDASGLNARNGLTGLFCSDLSAAALGVADMGRELTPTPETVCKRMALRSLRDSGPIVCCRFRFVGSGDGGSLLILCLAVLASSCMVINEVSLSPSPFVVVSLF